MTLALIAVGLLAAIFYAPIWWVSLTAPNYPAEAFPDGVRIHFHMNGVFNGCRKVEKTEIQESEALDCVHEMDTINHYVGMYPIAAGGVVEKSFSPFLVSLLGIMVLGFACRLRPLRLGMMGVAFAGLAVWMWLVYYGEDGLRYHDTGYLEALVTSMDQEATSGGAEEALDPAAALIARLRASLEQSGVPTEQAAPAAEASAKEAHLRHLRSTFEHDQGRKAADERQAWTGSGSQVMSWHYAKSLGRYFNNPAEIEPMVRTMSLAGHLVFWGILAVMPVLLFGAWKGRGPLYWLLILVPMALPLFFLIEYSAWLWWYGHSLNEMGAFTVKPFMPTVFGQGKVAQFATHSYPYWGFGLMLLFAGVTAVIALRRRGEG